MISIPEAFSNRIIAVHGQKGQRWLNSLKETLVFCEDRWKLKALYPFTLSFNYVAPVVFKNLMEGVLKLCIPGNDCRNEIQVLKVYDGEGFCRLIDSVEDRGIILLERLSPGDNLKSITHDEAGVKIAASLIRRMKDTGVDVSYSFPTIAEWAKGLSRLREHFKGGAGPFPENVVQRAEKLFPHLVATQKDQYVLHGDFHHENILQSDGEWRLIDPKGLIGEVEYEIIPFLMNNLPEGDFERVIENRIRCFNKELNIDVDRTYAWGLCHSLLSAWWNIEDHFSVSEHDLGIVNFFYDRNKSFVE